MVSLYTELALYGCKNECARTDTAFLSTSEVCDGMVSLKHEDIRLSVRNAQGTPTGF